MDRIDPAIFDDPAMRAALSARDIGVVFRLLTEAGISQRRIADLTGTGASEVSEVLKGRQVMAYDVLVRIVDGLGVPRGLAGLAYDPDTAERYGGNVPADADPWEGVDEDMKRRHFLAAASAAVWGHPVLGKLLDLPTPPNTPSPLPGRLAMSDVDAVRALTEQLQAVSRQYGGYSDGLTPVAARAEQLLAVPAAEPVKRALASAVAELHTVAAWAADDARLNDTARRHFTRALDLAAEAGDHFAVSKAIYLSGVATAEQGHHDDGLKLLQLGQIRLADAAGHPRAPELSAWMSADTAVVLAQLSRPEQARSALAAARDTWHAPNTDDQADMDWVTALAEMRLGRIDTAEQLVSSSMRLWEGTADRRQATLGRITLAQLHVQAGEPRGLTMAERTIRDVAELRSQRARERLAPLADALAERRDATSRELAGHARRVAATV